jgi:hypothetical protein
VMMFVRPLGWLVYERRGEPRAGDHGRMEGSIVYALRLCLVFSSHCKWAGILKYVKCTGNASHVERRQRTGY